MAVGNLVKRLRDIMRKDAGINGDAQRIEYTAEPTYCVKRNNELKTNNEET